MGTSDGAAGRADVAVFLGPTMPRAEARPILDATYLPPVQQGDVYRIARARPLAIVIVDGYFNWVRAVWHKEILWALAQGVHVFGCSSMGALRAAELQPYGMVGAGSVFQDYLTGKLEDDDEVAVMHAGPEDGYRALSDAMVNIRATIAHARSTGVVTEDSERLLIGHFKRLFYADRQLRACVLPGDDDLATIPGAELGRLNAWVKAHHVDVKRRDAESLLRQLADWASAGPPPFEPAFLFQATSNWSQLAQRAGGATQPRAGRGAAEVGLGELLTECRLNGTWPTLELEALVRLLAGATAPQGRTVTDDELGDQLARLCTRFGLQGTGDILAWLETTAWNGESLARALEQEAMIEALREYWRDEIASTARDLLRLRGREPALLSRAQRKRGWLESVGGRASLVRLDPQEALDWFREQRSTSPGQSTASLAKQLDWRSAADMADDVVCEYFFRREAEGGEDVRPAVPSLEGRL